MCTQYTPTRADRIAQRFGVRPPREDYVAQAFPGHVAPILRQSGSALQCDLAVFGLIPYWSRDGRNFRHCYNARSETIAEKPSFRQPWRRQQWCAIVADAFFEPCYETGRPVRWRIAPAQEESLLIAGVWDHWQAPDGRAVLSFTMITQNADTHPVMRRFHPPDDEKRSVVLLEDSSLQAWLNASTDQARALIRPFAAERVHISADPLRR